MKMLETKTIEHFALGTCFNKRLLSPTERSPVMEILLNEFTWQGQVMAIFKLFVKKQNKLTINI